VETIDDGWNIPVGFNKEKIKRTIRTIQPLGSQRNIFGYSNASEKIEKILEKQFT